MSISEYYTRQELADHLKTTSDHLAKMALSGDGPPYIRIGKYCRYPKDELIKWESERLQRSTSDHNHRGSPL